MSEQTNIGWCDFTWGPWEGCVKVSPGCLNCYAEARNHRFGNDNWGKGKPRRLTAESGWRIPLKWNRAAGSPVAVNWSHTDDLGEPAKRFNRPTVFPSLCDPFDEEVPVEWLARFLKLIHDTPNLTWLLLTKRPELFQQRILAAALHFAGFRDGQTGAKAVAPPDEAVCEMACGWSKLETFPRNVWIGTSVENQEYADKRIPELLKIPAVGHFLSCEPLLGPVDLRLPRVEEFRGILKGTAPILRWIIIGGESGRGARPCNVEWIGSLVRQGKAARKATLVKQLGADPYYDPPIMGAAQIGLGVRGIKHPKGGDPEEWPEDLRVREFPDGLR